MLLHESSHGSVYKGTFSESLRGPLNEMGSVSGPFVFILLIERNHSRQKSVSHETIVMQKHAPVYGDTFWKK